MKTAVYYFLILILAVALASCSGSGKTDKERKMDVMIGKVNAWINLMPGSRARFHLKGNLDISSDTKIPPDSISISEILIFQNEKLIYSFVPATTFENQEGETSRSIRFSEPESEVLKGLPNADYPVNIQMFILHSGKKLVLDLNDVKVEKVY